MKNIIAFFLIVLSAQAFAQETRITGRITDAASGEPLSAVSIHVKGKLIGTVTGEDGQFRLTVNNLALPFTILLSSINHGQEDVEITRDNQSVIIALLPKAALLNEVVTAASRVQENILRSPVTIEKMTLKDIRENPSLTYYDGLQKIKGIEMVTSSLTYKQVNTRGFNTTGNSRFLQMIDGVDNQTPGLNFAVGNLFGASDIDVESVEVIPGAASVLYGPMAFNGALLIRTRDPFQYQGLSVQAKSGLNHIGESGVGARGLYDFSLRYAKAFKDRFAFKINASYLGGTDWYAMNYTDVSAQTPPEKRGPDNPGRDALNVYGDEVSRTLSGIGLVSRTGYEEKDLMNYQVYSLKINGALHYRITNNLEAVYQYNIGKGTASYTGSSRFDLNNFVLQTHRIEFKGSNYFLRGYMVSENSQDSYNTRSLAQFINRGWVQDLDGKVVSADQADDIWFTRYEEAYKGSISGIIAGHNQEARAFADRGRLLPGTIQFNEAKEKAIHDYGLNGAGVFSNSKFYHTDGQYDFSNSIKIFELLTGASFRYYDMFTNGSLFDDKTNKVTIKEYGAFVQAAKNMLDDKLKITASIRYDKDENFVGNFTPRFSAVYSVAKTHHFRASYQTGFRNPTPVDQFIKLNVGPITILGGAPKNSAGMQVYENSFTAGSAGAFGAAFGSAMAGGTSFPDAVAGNKDLLQKSDVAYIKPEKQKAFEVGYKGLFQNKFLVDINYYYSAYTNFILNTVVIQPQHDVHGGDGTINFEAAADILNGDIHAFQLFTNAPDKVSSQGISGGLTYIFNKGYNLGGNLTWASFNLRNANPDNIAAFNTPEYSSNLSFRNSNAFKGFGFEIAWHWQSAFDWYGAFAEMMPGRISSYSLFDLQINKKLPKIHSTIKLGSSNIFNKRVYQAYGSPAVGAIYYVAVTFEDLLK